MALARTTTNSLQLLGAGTRLRSQSAPADRPHPASADLAPTLLLSLQAFDAAVRLGSFKAAAAALRITPSAVSHRIRNLEQAIGERLFERVHRAVLPTQAGKNLCTQTSRAFSELLRATQPHRDKQRRRRLRISVIPLFGAAWLIPRVAHFMAQHNDVELSIESSTRFVDFDSEPFDAAIRAGDGDWPGLTAIRLMSMYTTPVAQPALAARLQLRSATDLLHAPLIHVSGFPNIWRMWLKQAGLSDPKPPTAISVDSFDAALQAAQEGAGIALGIEPFFAERERAGRLCRPLPIRILGPTCWLVYRPSDTRHATLHEFKRWLLAQLKGELLPPSA